MASVIKTSRCAWDDEFIVQPQRGRPRKYCSDTCRQAAARGEAPYARNDQTATDRALARVFGNENLKRHFEDTVQRFSREIKDTVASFDWIVDRPSEMTGGTRSWAGKTWRDESPNLNIAMIAVAELVHARLAAIGPEMIVTVVRQALIDERRRSDEFARIRATDEEGNQTRPTVRRSFAVSSMTPSLAQADDDNEDEDGATFIGGSAALKRAVSRASSDPARRHLRDPADVAVNRVMRQLKFAQLDMFDSMIYRLGVLARLPNEDVLAVAKSLGLADLPEELLDELHADPLRYMSRLFEGMLDRDEILDRWNRAVRLLDG
jgi:hypothetical protein